MKIGAAIAAIMLLAATLLAGCPNPGANVLEKSQKPGNVLPDDAAAGQTGELTQGTPPAGGSTPPPATPPPAGNSGSGSGDTGGGDSGGDDDGGE